MAFVSTQPLSAGNIRSEARDATVRNFRSRSIKVQWEASISNPPDVMKLRECFEVYGPVSTVRLRDQTGLVLYKDAQSVLTALTSYNGPWCVHSLVAHSERRAHKILSSSSTESFPAQGSTAGNLTCNTDTHMTQKIGAIVMHSSRNESTIDCSITKENIVSSSRQVSSALKVSLDNECVLSDRNWSSYLNSLMNTSKVEVTALKTSIKYWYKGREELHRRLDNLRFTSGKFNDPGSIDRKIEMIESPGKLRSRNSMLVFRFVPIAWGFGGRLASVRGAIFCIDSFKSIAHRDVIAGNQRASNEQTLHVCRLVIRDASNRLGTPELAVAWPLTRSNRFSSTYSPSAMGQNQFADDDGTDIYNLPFEYITKVHSIAQTAVLKEHVYSSHVDPIANSSLFVWATLDCSEEATLIIWSRLLRLSCGNGDRDSSELSPLDRSAAFLSVDSTESTLWENADHGPPPSLPKFPIKSCTLVNGKQRPKRWKSCTAAARIELLVRTGHTQAAVKMAFIEGLLALAMFLAAHIDDSHSPNAALSLMHFDAKLATVLCSTSANMNSVRNFCRHDPRMSQHHLHDTFVKHLFLGQQTNGISLKSLSKVIAHFVERHMESKSALYFTAGLTRSSVRHPATKTLKSFLFALRDSISRAFPSAAYHHFPTWLFGWRYSLRNLCPKHMPSRQAAAFSLITGAWSLGECFKLIALAYALAYHIPAATCHCNNYLAMFILLIITGDQPLIGLGAWPRSAAVNASWRRTLIVCLVTKMNDSSRHSRFTEITENRRGLTTGICKYHIHLEELGARCRYFEATTLADDGRLIDAMAACSEVHVHLNRLDRLCSKVLGLLSHDSCTSEGVSFLFGILLSGIEYTTTAHQYQYSPAYEDVSINERQGLRGNEDMADMHRVAVLKFASTFHRKAISLVLQSTSSDRRYDRCRYGFYGESRMQWSSLLTKHDRCANVANICGCARPSTHLIPSHAALFVTKMLMLEDRLVRTRFCPKKHISCSILQCASFGCFIVNDTSINPAIKIKMQQQLHSDLRLKKDPQRERIPPNRYIYYQKHDQHEIFNNSSRSIQELRHNICERTNTDSKSRLHLQNQLSRNSLDPSERPIARETIETISEERMSRLASYTRPHLSSNCIDAKRTWLSRRVVSFFFPRASFVDLDAASTKMEAYYDKALGRWIFPDLSPSESKAEIGIVPLASSQESPCAPPIRANELASLSGDVPSTTIKTSPSSHEFESQDALTALTAPPPLRLRASTLRARQAGVSSSGGHRHSDVSSQSHQFAVFTPGKSRFEESD